MSEMLERMARAVREAREMSLCQLCDRQPHFVRCSCKDLARAALLALREPTEGMSLAGHKVNRWTNPIRCDNPDCVYSVRLSPDEAFRAMIDAALSETQETSE